MAGIGWVICSFGTRVLVRIAGSHWTVEAWGTELLRESRRVLHTVVTQRTQGAVCLACAVTEKHLKHQTFEFFNFVTDTFSNISPNDYFDEKFQ